MNIINCSPFNGNFRNCGSFGPACQQEESSCGCNCCNCCNCCCGCCNHCGCNSGCGSQPDFVPTPQIPFACIVGCAREGRVDWSGAPSCGCNCSNSGSDCGCGCNCGNSGSDCGCGCNCGNSGSNCGCGCNCNNSGSDCGCGCNCGNNCSDCGCSSNNDCACAAEGLLSNPCFGLAAIKCELDEVRQITGEIYNMMAPVPVCGQCGCNSCGC